MGSDPFPETCPVGRIDIRRLEGLSSETFTVDHLPFIARLVTLRWVQCYQDRFGEKPSPDRGIWSLAREHYLGFQEPVIQQSAIQQLAQLIVL